MYKFELLNIFYLSSNVVVIKAFKVAGNPSYVPGQYALIKVEKDLLLPYSIADYDNETITFYIKVNDSSSNSHRLLENIKKTNIIEIASFNGDVLLSNIPATNLVLVAGGTGISQIQSLALDCYHNNISCSIYWGVDSPNETEIPEFWGLINKFNIPTKLFYSNPLYTQKGYFHKPYPYQGVYKDYAKKKIFLVSSGPLALQKSLKYFIEQKSLNWKVYSDI